MLQNLQSLSDHFERSAFEYLTILFLYPIYRRLKKVLEANN